MDVKDFTDIGFYIFSIGTFSFYMFSLSEIEGRYGTNIPGAIFFAIVGFVLEIGVAVMLFDVPENVLISEYIFVPVVIGGNFFVIPFILLLLNTVLFIKVVKNIVKEIRSK